MKYDLLRLLNKVRPGACPECAKEHDPAQPHDAQSWHYQYKFYSEHGRWPTWDDAMAHCAPDVKRNWAEKLIAYGVKMEKPNGENETDDQGVRI